jgi:hypothetical protein
MAAGKSYFGGTVTEFLKTPTAILVGQLSTRVSSEHRGDEAQQIKAWQIEVELLKVALASDACRDWGILLELPLLRLGRRIDAIILIGEGIACIEFKIGASRFSSADIDQAVDYALCLRDFHSGSRSHRIVPILCADQAPDALCDLSLSVIEDVGSCMRVNASNLAVALSQLSTMAGSAQIGWREYDASSYSPTPDIVTAARALYAGHGVKEVGRADAPAKRWSVRLIG